MLKYDSCTTSGTAGGRNNMFDCPEAAHAQIGVRGTGFRPIKKIDKENPIIFILILRQQYAIYLCSKNLTAGFQK